MHGTSQCPPVEALALIMEGQASGGDRKEWMSHIDECADCRIVLAGVAEYEGDRLERSALDNTVSLFKVPWARLFRFRILGPLSAAAALLLVFMYTPPLFDVGSPGSAPELADLLFMEGGVAYSSDFWQDDSRGAAFATGLTDQQLAVRMGVHLVDFWIALREQSMEAAGASLHELEELAALMGSADALTASLSEVREALAGGDFDSASTTIQRVEQALREELDPVYLRFGAWAEASRLAAARGQVSFFRSKAFQAGLVDISEHGFQRPITKHLEKVESLIAEPTVAGSVEREFRQLILLY